MARGISETSKASVAAVLTFALLMVPTIILLQATTQGEPVAADPGTFGYEDQGGSWQTVDDNIHGSWSTAPETGTVTSITAYVDDPMGPAHYKFAIYDKGTDDYVGATEEGFSPQGGGWLELDIVDGGSVTEGENYWLFAWGEDAANQIAYDAEAGKGGYLSQSYGEWPGAVPSITYEDRKYSIYATYSLPSAPTQPVLYYPDNDSTISNNMPTFEWTCGEDADNHRILVDDDSDCSSPIDNEMLGATDNTWIKTGGSYSNGVYFWKVIAINAQGENTSEIWTFTMAAPTQPQLYSPEDDATTSDDTPYFEWENGQNAENHRFLLDNDSDFSSPEENRIILNDNDYTIGDENWLSNENYYWKVAAIGAGGEENWSGARTLNIFTRWTSPQAIENKCGENVGYEATNAIDENTSTYWLHDNADYHWVIFDMGSSKMIEKVRIYQSETSSERWGGAGTLVYVSDNTENWGDNVLVAGFTTSGWDAESVSTVRNGRYIKLVSNKNTATQQLREFQVWVGEGITINLVYAGKDEIDWANYVQMPDDYVEIKVELAYSENIENVVLEWFDNGVWENYDNMDDLGGNLWFENVVGLENERLYSFNVRVEDNTGNVETYEWTRTDNTGTTVRRYIGADYAVTDNLQYTQFYLWAAHYISYSGGLDHDQIPDGSFDDTGYLLKECPENLEERHCASFAGFYMNENMTLPPSSTIDNIYVHIWWHTTDNDDKMVIWKHPKSLGGGAILNNFDMDNNTAKYSVLGVYLGGGTPAYNTYFLESRFWDISNLTCDSNDIYQFAIGNYDGDVDYPSWICSRNYPSFIILNVPDNATLQSMDSDSDSWTDYDELYTHYTNPFESDTDGDGIADASDSKPLDYWGWHLMDGWSGTLQVPREWRLVETWTGTVETPVAWELIGTWTGMIEASAEWQLIASWTGTVEAFAQWNLIETWAGTVEAFADWDLIETWAGTVLAYAGWSEIESWAGTIHAVGWKLVETWTGTIQNPSAVVTTESATDVGMTIATLNALVSYGSYPSVDVRFQYRVLGAGTWTNTDWENDYTATVYSKDMTGLSPDTTYQFKGHIQFGAFENYGSIVEFTTQAEAPPTQQWYLTETWTGTIQTADVVRWREAESWGGTITAAAQEGEPPSGPGPSPEPEPEPEPEPVPIIIPLGIASAWSLLIAVCSIWLWSLRHGPTKRRWAGDFNLILSVAAILTLVLAYTYKVTLGPLVNAFAAWVFVFVLALINLASVEAGPPRMRRAKQFLWIVVTLIILTLSYLSLMGVF